jgi:hypothetical protein
MEKKDKTIVIRCKRASRKPPPTMNQPDKFDKLVEFLDAVKQEDFSGYIKINFSQGSVGRIEKCEKLLD